MTTNAYLPDGETQIAIYRKLSLLKLNDQQLVKSIRTGRLVMSYYAYRGQEAIPASLCVSLRDDDYLCTIYRGIHDMVSKGMPLKDLWAEIAGRETGICKGKGGPMHLTYPKKGVMVTTGIVGSSMPIATGLGWGIQLDKRDSVSVATFGDGAANIGAFHESLNLAALWKLPVIYVCQNNGFSEHTRFEHAAAIDQVSARASGYGMPGYTVDGKDPIALYSVFKEAVERARAGEGPTLIEATTRRYYGHVLGDPCEYIEKDEIAAAQSIDAIAVFRQKLIDTGVATEDVLAKIDADAEAELEEAVEYAMSAPLVSVDELSTDVYGAAA